MSKPIGIFEQARVVVDDDCDALGHVNNAVWVRFLADLAEAHAEVLGIDHAGMAAMGGAWVARTHTVHYYGEAWPGETINEQTWVSSLKGPRCIRHYRFTNAAGELLFRGDTEWIFVDVETHRPRRLTQEVIDKFAQVPGDSESGPERG